MLRRAPGEYPRQVAAALIMRREAAARARVVGDCVMGLAGAERVDSGGGEGAEVQFQGGVT